MAAKHLSGDAPDELPGQGGTGGGGGPTTLPDGDYGDITVSGGGTAMSIDSNAVDNSKLADVPTATIKGRSTAGTGDPEDLTATQATALLNQFTAADKGLAPASGGGTANFLRADGTWAAPPAGGGGGGVPTAVAVGLVMANGTGQTVAYTGGVARQVTLQTEVVDPAGFYNTSTGRYIPNIAGYYRVTGGVISHGAASELHAHIYVNGAVALSGDYAVIPSASNLQLAEVNGVVFLNGTTDYLELWASSNPSGTSAAGLGSYFRLHVSLVAT